MSATLLRRIDMSESTRQTFHAVVSKTYGKARADLIFGKITASPVANTTRRVYMPVSTEARQKSRDTKTCAQCSTDLRLSEIASNTYRYQGKISFYLCNCCQREAFLSGNDQSEQPRPKIRVEVEED